MLFYIVVYIKLIDFIKIYIYIVVKILMIFLEPKSRYL